MIKDFISCMNKNEIFLILNEEINFSWKNIMKVLMLLV